MSGIYDIFVANFFSSGVETLPNDHFITTNDDCSHIFHHECLSIWFVSCLDRDNNGTCPICRALLITAPGDIEDELWANLAAGFLAVVEDPASLLEIYSQYKRLLGVAHARNVALGIDMLDTPEFLNFAAFCQAYEEEIAT
jgi:hypothetical protein